MCCTIQVFMHYCSIVHMFFPLNSKHLIANTTKILIFYPHCNADDMKVHYIEYTITQTNKLISLLKIIFQNNELWNINFQLKSPLSLFLSSLSFCFCNSSKSFNSFWTVGVNEESRVMTFWKSSWASSGFQAPTCALALRKRAFTLSGTTNNKTLR